ncbi:MAG: PqqD family protein [Candidatus Marinimicrobia bacterium]|nr:PqqD family protein [Candidatus Neomarinimicrobiota bacterium]
MRNKEKKTEVNLLELVPKRILEWEYTDDGLVTLKIPKFRGKLGNFITSKMNSPDYTVQLDAVGSFVWKECDGEKNVLEISQKMKDEFGDDVEPLYERISFFIKTLTSSKAIELL